MLKRTIELSLSLAKAEFKLRNEGSYLGVLWYLLNPLLMFSLLLLVFFDRLGNDIPSYPLYLLLGIIMFNFFRQATIESTKTIYNNRWIIKSINFPREALVGSIVLKTFFSHIFEIIVLAVFLLFFNVPVWGIIFYPLVLLLLSVFVLGVSFALSAFTVYFIDLENVWLFASHLLWFATPIFYAIGGQERLFVANLFNPMYYFITISRDIIIYGKMPELWMVGGAIFCSVTALTIGFLIFNKLKHKFAELI
jgi:ABC-type polysaccharide/polyol phosphate export permease